MLAGTCGVSAIFSSRATTLRRTQRAKSISSDRTATLWPSSKSAPAALAKAAAPELSIAEEKHKVLLRTAHYFLRNRHIQDCPARFDVVVIGNTPGQPPTIRLHKAALSPQLPVRAA